MTQRAPFWSTAAVLVPSLACGLLVCCSRGPEPPDTIQLTSFSGENPAVLLDGRRPTPPCVGDELKTGSASFTVDNLLTPETCSSEVATFAVGHAMRLLAPVSSWTDSGGDVLDVPMAVLADVPLAVWIMFQNDSKTREIEVNLDVNRAAALFDTQRCGVEFNATVNDVTHTPFDFELLDGACDRREDYKKVAFQSGKVNVYYIRTADGGQGQFCDDGSSNVILIGGYTNDNETLAHELGHIMSLGHSNDISGLTETNLMVSGGSARDSLSLGQCFRSNVNTASLLNRSGIRSGPTRDCPDKTTNDSCPPITVQ